MAPQVLNDFVALVCAHPVIVGATLVLFTPPFFPIVKFFSPLLISTALFMLALFTMGPKRNGASQDEDEDLTLQSDGDGEKVFKQMKPDGGWKDWVKSIEESSLSWMSSPRSSSKLQKNWKNDENVSILEEASWVKGADFRQSEYGEDTGPGQASATFMPSLLAPSELFKVDSDLQSAAERSIYPDMELGEDAPELEDVVESASKPVAAPVAEPVAEPVRESESPNTQLPGASSETSASVPSHGVQHQPLQSLQIPNRAESDVTISPATDLDDESPIVNNTRRLLFANLKRSSLNASSGRSDADSPAAVPGSLSGKLKQMEELGEFLDDAGLAEQAGEEPLEVSLLKPTSAEEVEDVKDQLASFVTETAASSETENSSIAAPSLAMPGKEAESSDPAMKVHPPVKLDTEQQERKLDI